jgi:hypothetical protein
LGLRQRGRSRLWLDDHGWWLVLVEFQLSSWSKGSYLNAGAMWLWYEKDYFSFDDGYRVEGFAPFEDEAQFSRVAEGLARRAAEEVRRYRSLYPSVHAAALHLAAKSHGFWSTFHTAVACGLSHNKVDAMRFFEEVAGTDDDRDWAQAAACLAREYATELEDPAGFRHRIREVVLRTRRLLRLEEMADIRFSEEG